LRQRASLVLVSLKRPKILQAACIGLTIARMLAASRAMSFYSNCPERPLPNQYVTLCDESDPDAPCIRLRMFGEIKQTFEMPYYGSIAVVVIARQTTCPANTVYVQLCLESEQYGHMCNIFPLPYSDEDMYYVMYDHMPEGEYTLYARY
jgi:hypothetical protein